MTSTFDLSYEEARRQARALLGPSAELQEVSVGPLKQRCVGVTVPVHGFVLVGSGQTWSEAISDAKKRQSITKG